jgi:hypothetical protein
VALHAQARQLESELAVLSSQCLDPRIEHAAALSREVEAWLSRRNANHTKASWRFTTAGLFALRPADDVGPRVLTPPRRVAAVPGGIADLAPVEADVAQQALVEVRQRLHGAPSRKFLPKRCNDTPGRGQQAADQGTRPCGSVEFGPLGEGPKGPIALEADEIEHDVSFGRRAWRPQFLQVDFSEKPTVVIRPATRTDNRGKAGAA